MNQELFLKLNQIMSEASPSKIIKQGNAFSILEIANPAQINNFFKEFSFEGLNVYSTKAHEQNLILSGESFYTDKNSKENELQTDIEIPFEYNKSRNLSISSFELNLVSMEIFIKIALI